MSEQIEARIQAAIERIQGSITDDGASVIYYDDNTQLHYLSPIEDLDDLADLMESDDADISGDAYGHWCAGQLTPHPECDEDGNVTE